MQCTVPFGRVLDSYSVRWFRGLVEVQSDLSQGISISDETGALIFEQVKISDASKGYYCIVSVDRDGDVVERQGSTIELNVHGKPAPHLSGQGFHLWECVSEVLTSRAVGQGASRPGSQTSSLVCN